MKKSCRQCIYGTSINYGTSDHEGHWACGYLLYTGERRPCPSDNCTVFVPKECVRRPKLALKGSHR